MRQYYIEARCPHCHSILNDEEVLIKGRPALKFLVENKGKRGYIWISAIYGDHETIEPEELNILPGDVVRFFCPHCEKPLPILDKCYCKADLIKIELATGGELKFCNRKGCYYGGISFTNPEDLDRFLGLK
ncbi:MAG TPA: hypothetical protein ENG11_01445 [candidate division Zixibacteria bacterium]|nr:hypothetical protein [candidate division Zixibacteria bacterium]